MENAPDLLINLFDFGKVRLHGRVKVFIVPHLLDIRKIERREVRIVLAEEFDGGLDGSSVAIVFVIMYESEIDGCITENLLVNGNPVDDGCGKQVRPNFLGLFEDRWVLVVVRVFKRVIQRLMLVRPDAGENAQPTGS